MIELIDTHTHIYIDSFDADRDAVLRRAHQAGIQTMILPSIDAGHTNSMLDVESENIHLMMGLHPCSVKPETYLDELAHVRAWIDKRAFVAIGEIGIDLHWDTTTKEIQLEAFEQQIDWAIEFDYPIIIHSRKSTQEVIDVLEKKSHPKLRGIFHCFGGTLAEANVIIGLGFYLGIGGVVTFKNAGLDKVVANIPIENIVLETDAPYLTPAPYRGKRNEPSYLRLIADKIAEVQNIPVTKVAETTTNNGRRIFGL